MPENPIVWRPDAELLTQSNVARFMRRHDISAFPELLRRSIEAPEWFWDAVVEFLDIHFDDPYAEVLDTSAGIPFATWFTGGRCNLATTCVDKFADDPAFADVPAVVWEGEEGDVRTLTYAELRSLVDRIASGLRARGVGVGDAVGLFLPMVPETVAALFAVAKLGAIFLPIFSGYGADAVAIRLDDADAVALITADGFTRRDRVVPMKETADEAAARVSTIHTVVVVPRLGRDDVPMQAGRDITLADLVRDQPDRFEAVRVDSEHPLFVAYTSGTTGRPKGAVHVHGGFLVKIAEEVAFQMDLQPRERLFWLTDIGWIMGPWEIVGTLANGGTLVMYDGAPDAPGPDRLWSIVERHRVAVLGVSPTLDPRPDGARGRSRDEARPVVAPCARVDGGALERSPVEVVLHGRRGRAVPDHQHLRRHRGGCLLLVTARRATVVGLLARRSCARHGGRRVRRCRSSGTGTGR